MSTDPHPAVTALSAAIEHAAGLLRVPTSQIEVEHLEARVWPDACLDAPREGEVCADVVTPGYLIRLGDGFVYHADQNGNVRRATRPDPYPDTEIRLHYSMSGGIMGEHRTYETDSWRLSEAEEQELRRLIEEADFFQVPNVLPSTTVYDGYTYRLWIAVGRRGHEVIRGDGIEANDTPAFQALMSWAAERLPPRQPRTPPDLS